MKMYRLEFSGSIAVSSEEFPSDEVEAKFKQKVRDMVLVKRESMELMELGTNIERLVEMETIEEN